MAKLLFHDGDTPFARWLVLGLGLLLSTLPCSASLKEPQTLLPPGHSHPFAAEDVVPGAGDVVIDRVVDGAFVVFLVGCQQQEWIARLREAPSGDHRLPVVVGDELVPGTWGRLEPGPSSLAIPPELSDGKQRTGPEPMVYTFISHPEATGRARERIKARLEALRHRGPAGPPTGAGPAAAAGPACQLLGSGLAPWPPDQVPPTAALPRPSPF